jgi:transcriptional regulator with XRE-family HTH domain
MAALDPEKLRRLRHERGLSQEELAQTCGLSRKTVQRMESGHVVQASTMAFVAAALGVAVADLAQRASEPDADTGHVGLRRVTSGKHVFQQLAQTSVGRLECDVDADRRSIEPISRLVATLQGLIRESWDLPRPATGELPMIERLKITAAINDDLHLLQAQGIGLYMGHYYRYAAPPAGASARSWETARQTPLVITRLHLARCARERMNVRIDSEWRGAPEAFSDTAHRDDVFTGQEPTVFLFPTPPLPGMQEAPDSFIDGVYGVVRP